MALVTTLAALCPSQHGHADVSDCNLSLVPRNGLPIRCHAELLRARCPALKIDFCGVAEAFEDSEVVYALLRWVYCEVVDSNLVEVVSHNLGSRVVVLARIWGLRDAGCLQSRVAARRVAARVSGTLTEDLLRAYDDGNLVGHFVLRPVEAEGKKDEDATKSTCLLPWCALIRGRSAYFGAMLGGAWAESSDLRVNRMAVKVRWPSGELAKLVKFLHGAEFVEGLDDLGAAVECAKFFGVPAVLSNVNEWIVEHLQVQTAPGLWCFLEGEPILRNFGDIDGAAEWHNDIEDADTACFDYHIRHFEELAEETEQDDGTIRVPLHDLSASLLRRLLASGLVEMPTGLLKGVVKRFAGVHVADKQSEEYADLVASLRPPAVLFNREHRRCLLPQGIITVWSFV